MARESQGLQIALIIAVMLAIILGVTTFIFYRNYGEAKIEAEAKRQAAFDEGQAKDTLAEQKLELMQQMGFPEMDLEEVREEFNKDMQTYGGNFPEEKRSYHDLLVYLNKTIQDKNTELDALKVENQKLKDDYVAREASKDPQIKQFEAAATQAQEDLTKVTSTAKTDRERITKELAAIEKQLDDARKTSAGKTAEIEGKLEAAVKRIGELATLLKRKDKELLGYKTETFETPHGKITYVNQSNGTAWINLGRADALGRQTTFSVYPADSSSLGTGGKKGSIEVTQILGENLAEARVTEDLATDPLMPGDEIYTPVWSPGEQKRFALAGFMDLDEDGKNDQDVVRNLIEVNGGVVDCWADAQGEVHGKMTIHTRYLVLGADPSEIQGIVVEQQANMIKGFSEIRDQADELGTQMISLGDLLQQMGWKHRTPVVTFGSGANPRDFRAKPDEGVSRVSSGTVSELFQPRRPPSGGPAPRGRAY